MQIYINHFDFRVSLYCVTTYNLATFLQAELASTSEEKLITTSIEDYLNMEDDSYQYP